MLLVAAITAIIAVAVGRYVDRRGLIIATLVVLAGTAIVLAGRYGIVAYVLFIALNVAIFEVIAVAMMLFLPAAAREKPALGTRPGVLERPADKRK